jgi:hypothetical protein
MEEADKEQDEDSMDIQGSYSDTIQDFRKGLLKWLEKEPQPGDFEDFEDRELDALLLRVSAELGT